MTELSDAVDALVDETKRAGPGDFGTWTASVPIEGGATQHYSVTVQREHDEAMTPNRALQRAETRIAALEKDKARLDWVAKHEATIYRDERIPTYGLDWARPDGSIGEERNENFREAIDAAMEGEQ